MTKKNNRAVEGFTLFVSALNAILATWSHDIHSALGWFVACVFLVKYLSVEA